MSLYISVLLYLDHIHWFLLLCHYTLLSYFILITFTGFCYCVILHYCLTLSWSHSLVFVNVSLYISVFFILITFTGFCYCVIIHYCLTLSWSHSLVFVIVSLYITVLLYLDHIHWCLLLCHYTFLSYFILITFTGFCYCVIIHYCLTLSWSHSLVFVIVSLYITVLLYLDHIHWFLLMCHYTFLSYFILITFTGFCYCVIIHFCLTLSWSHSLVFVIVSLYITVLLYLDHNH